MFERMFLVLLASTMFMKGCLGICKGTTCAECVSSDYTCAWCTQNNFTGSRCESKLNLISAGCEEGNVENPMHSFNYIEDAEVADSNRNVQAIQIQPQKVKINARPRKETKFTMTFRAANNYPVDLYFLFDNSLSMEKEIKNLGRLANDIGLSIGNISRNYRMGYGVFQDKVILPFTDTSPAKCLDTPAGHSGPVLGVSRKINPCVSEPSRKCAPPYEFKHLLNMTANVTEFKDKVDKTLVTGNLDHPEGSTDAIMQAITCKNQIGWRDVGRKLLIFASNDRFHLAGDGRLAGIILPNDGSCHLDVEGRYSKELEQDYPSVGQLTETVAKNQVHIIFVVTQNQDNLFRQLSVRIPYSTVESLVSSNDTGSKNIREIIEKKYREIISEVEIIHNEVKGVDIQIKATSPECVSQGTNKCKGLKIGIPIKFDVEVKVLECPKNPQDRIKKVIIYPTSLENDKLEIEIDTICDCSCANDSTKWEVNSAMCSEGNGTLKCGICDCNEGRFGQLCECGATEIGSSKGGCINSKENSTVECSGAGKCECGVCNCDPHFSGAYCQCNDRACGVFERKVCGGVTRGRCDCGKCACEREYTGIACDCPTSNRTCFHEEKLCNNVGVCECGKCKQCQKGYIGDNCEICSQCGDICGVPPYRNCAECAIEVNKDKCPIDNCPQIEVVELLPESDELGVCPSRQDNGCILMFRVITSDTNVTLQVQRKLTCPEPISPLPIALGVIGGVVAIGLLVLLLWKILTSVFDRIEYSKFQEDVKNCKWAQQDNPFYKGATTTYRNPMMQSELWTERNEDA